MGRTTATENHAVDVKPECCIFKLHKHLREMNGTAYMPQILAIGPYHRKNHVYNSSSSEEHKVNFSMMEEHKKRYLNDMLKRKDEGYVNFLRAEIKPRVQEIREFYAEPLIFSNDELVDMMILDGCFIIELVRKKRMPHLRQPDDPIFKIKYIRNSLRRDLLLFENQLPLFVLHTLFNNIEHENDLRFFQILLKFFHKLFPEDKGPTWDLKQYSVQEVRHLVELIHLKWYKSVEEMTSEERMMMEESSLRRRKDIDGKRQKRFSMPCATELREAGVEFKKFIGKGLFDIRFTNGTLHIPPLVIKDGTEEMFRNLVAYEQYIDRDRRKNHPMCVTDYVYFLDNLIDTPKDVEILRTQGIINNFLGDDKGVCKIFNNISHSIIVSRKKSRYYLMQKS